MLRELTHGPVDHLLGLQLGERVPLGAHPTWVLLRGVEGQVLAGVGAVVVQQQAGVVVGVERVVALGRVAAQLVAQHRVEEERIETLQRKESKFYYFFS